MILRRTSLLVLLALLVGCASRPPYDRGAVAADHAIASAAGVEILRAGGNAVDAAVATSFTLSVVRPYSCGLGGGGFMVIHLPADPNHGRVTTAINYRETAPAVVGPEYYEAPSHSSRIGATAVAVPGSVAGLLYALDHYGTMSRAEVLAPAIRAAKHGFIVDEHYVNSASSKIAWYAVDPTRKTRFPFVWKRFLREGRVKVGDRISLPEQAAALRLIAEHGESAFYDGPIADAIIAAIERDGGNMKQTDLAAYRAREAEPIRFTFMDRQFLTMPPPSSGGIAMGQILGIFDRIRPPPTTGPMFTSHVMVHALTEAMKHAFADRARWLGDPAFVDVPVDRLLSDEYLDARAARFDPEYTLPPDAYGTSPPDSITNLPPDDSGTSHFCVVDRWGGAVACTETINLAFGSRLAVPEFGFCLNNEMDDFTTRRGKANAFGLIQSDRNLPAPGKRPLSSMSPTIVLGTDGRVEIIAGASGGPRIITGTTQAILNVLLFDESAADAVAAPRFHHQWKPDVLFYEQPWYDRLARITVKVESNEEPSSILDLYQEFGYTIQPRASVGNVQLIRRTHDNRWDPASDPRKGGRPAGY